MTPAELNAEKNRIIAQALLIPQKRRLKWVKSELEKLPPEWREFTLSLVATTEVFVKDDLSVKTVRNQIVIGVACIAVGMILAFKFDQPTGIQYLFERGLFAMGMAALAVAVLVGTVRLKWNVASSLIITATGGAAILILMYYVNPPAPPNPGLSQPDTITTNSSRHQ